MRLAVQLRKAARRLRSYKPPLEDRGAFLRLDFNENTVGCATAVCQALARLGPAEAATYPDQAAAVRRLAPRLGVRSSEMVLTAGTDDALRLVVDAFVDPTDPVLLVEPSFAMYRFCASRAGARVRAIRYGKAMGFPLSRVLSCLTRRPRPRVLFLANPNNPTGTLLDRDDLARVLDAAQGTMVVIDEAYHEFSGVSVLDWIRNRPNLIVTRTFSKAIGLAALRIGALFAHRGLAGALRAMQSPYPVTTPALVAAEVALAEEAWVRDYVAEVTRAREALIEALGRIGVPCFPSAGNFVLVDFGPGAPALLRGLRREGILLRDRSSDFGRTGYVRITVGTRAQMRRLSRALEGLLS